MYTPPLMLLYQSFWLADQHDRCVSLSREPAVSVQEKSFFFAVSLHALKIIYQFLHIEQL